MHTIKFRGQILNGPKKGEWVYGSLLHGENIVLPSGKAYPVDTKTVGQYIGLNDKDGQEIYEGDKLQIGELTTFLVPKIMYLSALHEYIKRRIWVKVIHDNPDLLTQ